MINLLSQATPNAPAALSTSWTDLHLLSWHAMGLEIRIGLLWIAIAIAVVAIIAFRGMWPRWSHFGSGFRFRPTKLTFGPLEVDVLSDFEAKRIANDAWIEIQTRKTGLPFDDQNDVIAEVYDSWYRLFGVLRDLSKTIPAGPRTADARKLVGLLLDVLNHGLRPHLTRWRARFHRWYTAAIAEEANRVRAPQEIQRDFPEYAELVADLRDVNTKFVGFANELGRFAHGG